MKVINIIFLENDEISEVKTFPKTKEGRVKAKKFWMEKAWEQYETPDFLGDDPEEGEKRIIQELRAQINEGFRNREYHPNGEGYGEKMVWKESTLTN